MPVAVRKTYKLFVGGEFIRSESGRTLEFPHRDGVAHVARASRKDLRDSVRVARTALPAWRAKSAYNRGQILYRLAEMLQARRAELVDSLVRGGCLAQDAARQVDCAIDRAVWYAGWCDKIEQVLSTKNPVAGPHFNVSNPEPTGVVGVVVPSRPVVLSLVSTVLPVLCGANTVVVLASEVDPATAVTLAEAIATADVPAGVVNLLTGKRDELLPHLARHMDVNALDLWIDGAEAREAALVAACDNVKRVRSHAEPPQSFWFSDSAQSPRWIESFMEIKTVWHPAGL